MTAAAPRTNKNARPGAGTPGRTVRREQDLLERVAWFSGLAMYFSTLGWQEQPKIMDYIPVGREKAVDTYGLAAYLGLDAFELFALMDTVQEDGFPLCLTPAGGVYQPRDEQEERVCWELFEPVGVPGTWSEEDQAKEECRGYEFAETFGGPSMPVRRPPETSPAVYMDMMRRRGAADQEVQAARRCAVRLFNTPVFS